MAKWGDMRQRNARIIDMARRGMTYSEIARRLFLSRERVRVIAAPIIGPRKAAPVPFSADEIAKMSAMADRGAAAIATELGRDIHSVITVAKKRGIPVASKRRDTYGDEARSQAIDLVRMGASYAEAAADLGMSKSAVIGACWRAGVSQKTQEDA